MSPPKPHLNARLKPQQHHLVNRKKLSQPEKKLSAKKQVQNPHLQDILSKDLDSKMRANSVEGEALAVTLEVKKREINSNKISVKPIPDKKIPLEAIGTIVAVQEAAQGKKDQLTKILILNQTTLCITRKIPSSS